GFFNIAGSGKPGKLIEFERVNDVVFRHNIFRVNDREANPKAGDLLLSHGNGPILVENNRFENDSVSFTTTDGVEIANNVFDGGGIAAGDAENFGRDDFVFGNRVHHNHVSAPGGRALHIAGNGVEAYDNILEGNTGIDLGPGGGEAEGLSNAEIWNNEITATHTGIRTINTMQNVVIRNNRIAMTDDSTWSVVLANEWSGDDGAGFVFEANSVVVADGGTSRAPPAALLFAHTLTMVGNTMGEVQIGGGSRIDFRNNTVDSRVDAHGVSFASDSPNTAITDNTIHIYPSKTPLEVHCVFARAGVTLSASVVTTPNTCLED
ncbi:MAG TPA: hypothetical protein PKD61_13530, partial [Polyangiaceae bacterium]|nr:hypothetical protein [Polyangiaceae bacterium]